MGLLRNRHRNIVDETLQSLIYLQKRPIIGSVARVILVLLGVHIPKTVQLGRDVIFHHPTMGMAIHPTTVIGDRVHIFQGVSIGRGDILLADYDPSVGANIVIEDDAVVGTGVAVMFTTGEPLVIGKGAMIGANSVLTRSVPAGEIWAGSPARKVGERKIEPGADA